MANDTTTQGYRAGVNAYISKPFDPEELVSLVDNVLLTHFKAELAAASAASSAAQIASQAAATEAANAVTLLDEEEPGDDKSVLRDVRRCVRR